MSYKSPIEVITGEPILQIENDIVKAVLKCGINVNETELRKALMYDRKQYTQGFEDGRKYEQEERGHGHWTRPYKNKAYRKCSVCGQIHCNIPWNAEYCPFCGAKMDEVPK